MPRPIELYGGRPSVTEIIQEAGLSDLSMISRKVLEKARLPELAHEHGYPVEREALVPVEVLEELSATIHEHFEDDYIVGAEFLVIKSGHIIMHEAYGWMDREELKPMEHNTIFNIRSMTKMLTGASAQILIDEGRLSLDDKVSQYLPGFNNRKSGGIIIEQLLTHRSGLPLSTQGNGRGESGVQG